jgi:hypothetical protein
MRPIFLSALILFTTLTAPEEYRCTYTRKVECDAASGCKTTPIGSAYLLIPHPDSMLFATMDARRGLADLPQIRRCDAKGCSPIEVTAVQSGMFINVGSTSGGHYLKIADLAMGDLKKGMFIESATMFLGAVTYWGSCAYR